VITAVDTSVVLDTFAADHTFGPRSSAFLRRAIAEGRLVACEVVWAEVVGAFPSAAKAEEALQRVGIEFEPIETEAAAAAGQVWRTYRERGGPRTRTLGDFLIGAHADRGADRLLTRDRGFYRTYFRRLRVLDPSAG
jgi:predicted nucleic acid-binding protein